MICDLHADIGYAISQERKKGNYHSYKQIQLPKRIQGGFSHVCMASYFEGQESYRDMQQMICGLREEIMEDATTILVRNKEDLYADAKMHAILSVEGMCGIDADVSQRIRWLYEQDIKIASLVWNEANALATGAKADPNRGLTALGKEVLKEMERYRIAVDVSHANEKTFWDIMEHTSGPVLATHSNAYSLCAHPRNLNDAQCLEIAKRDGLIGIVLAKGFVHAQEQAQDLAHIVEHIRYLCDRIGIQHVAFGLDFMDDFQDGTSYMIQEVPTPSYAKRILQEMRRQGFDDAAIDKIAYKNALAFLEHIL